MKSIKNFDQYIKEDLSSELESEIGNSELDRKNYDIERESSIDEEEGDERIEDNLSQGEEDDEYIGVKLMKDLSDKLDTPVQDNKIIYDGNVINFYSETERFHIGKKKFETPDEVVDYLTK